MIDVRELIPGQGVWEATEQGPRRVEYAAPYGINKIEARFNGFKIYCYVSECFATKAECYALVIERAVGDAMEVLNRIERLSQESRKEG